MSLLRSLVGVKGRINIATSPEVAPAVLAAVSALRVPGARVTRASSGSAGGSALTSVEYRYHHPLAECLLMHEIQHAAFAARTAHHLGGVATLDPAAALFAQRLGLDLTDWQRDLLRRLEHRS